MQGQASGDPAKGVSRILALALGFIPRILNLALRWIPRIPFYSRVAPFLGLNELSSMRPALILGVLAITGFLAYILHVWGISIPRRSFTPSWP